MEITLSISSVRFVYYIRSVIGAGQTFLQTVTKINSVPPKTISHCDMVNHYSLRSDATLSTLFLHSQAIKAQ